MAQLCVDLTLILGVNRYPVGVRWRVLIRVPSRSSHGRVSSSARLPSGAGSSSPRALPSVFTVPPPHTPGALHPPVAITKIIRRHCTVPWGEWGAEW